MHDSPADGAPPEMPRVSEDTLWQSHRMIALSQLTAGVAHEFNNLMQNVIASMEVMRKLIRTGRAHDGEALIARAIASAQAASLLNQGVSRFVRPQAIAPEELSLNAVIAAIEDMLRRLLSRAYALEVAPAPDLWTTYCDAAQAEAVLFDMVLLARDSMPGGGTIAVGTRNDEGLSAWAGGQGAMPGRSVHLTVAALATSGRPSADDPTAPRATCLTTGALAMAHRFARTYGGEMRVSVGAAGLACAELRLPRFVAQD